MAEERWVTFVAAKNPQGQIRFAELPGHMNAEVGDVILLGSSAGREIDPYLATIVGLQTGIEDWEETRFIRLLATREICLGVFRKVWDPASAE